MIGSVIGHYEIVEKLGEGGMGVIFKARDTSLNRFVAIKLLPAGKAGDENRIRRFTQKARTASALNRVWKSRSKVTHTLRPSSTVQNLDILAPVHSDF